MEWGRNILIAITTGALLLPIHSYADEIELIRDHNIESFDEVFEIKATPMSEIVIHGLIRPAVPGAAEELSEITFYEIDGYSTAQDSELVWYLRLDPWGVNIPKVELEVHTDDQLNIKTLDATKVDSLMTDTSQFSEADRREVATGLLGIYGWMFVPLPDDGIRMNDVLLEGDDLLDGLLMEPPLGSEILKNTLEARVVGVSYIDGQTLAVLRHGGSLVFRDGIKEVEITVDGHSYIDVDRGLVVEFKMLEAMQPPSDPDRAFMEIDNIARLLN